MATVSKSAELYLSKKHPLPANAKYNSFYATGVSAVHKDQVTWTGQRKLKTSQECKKC